MPKFAANPGFLFAEVPLDQRFGRAVAGFRRTGNAIEGEAREVGKAPAGIAISCGRHGFPAKKTMRAAVWRRKDGDLLVTGPTRTNVNDFRTLLAGLE